MRSGLSSVPNEVIAVQQDRYPASATGLSSRAGMRQVSEIRRTGRSVRITDGAGPSKLEKEKEKLEKRLQPPLIWCG